MIRITHNASLLPHNTFGMDVNAVMLAEYDTIDDLRQLLHLPHVIRLMQQERQAGRLPFWHIGAGSNLLFTGHYPGVILHCTSSGIRMVEPEAGQAEADPSVCYLDVDAGTLWDDVCAYCAQHGLYGPENLSLIPGEAGAAAVQNIGAYGVEICNLIDRVVAYDVQADCSHTFSATEMRYAYRDSLLKQPQAKARYIVTSLRLRVQRTPRVLLDYAGLRAAIASAQPTAAEVRQAVIDIRRHKLPDTLTLGNAGSFFKNPVISNDTFAALQAQYPDMPHYVVDDSHTKVPAGWLIEQCGWKGRNLGQAGVYERQSLVLVNRGGARPDELLTLCHTIIADVSQRFGIDIHPEVNII